MATTYYEACVTQAGEVRDVIVRGNLEGAKRATVTLQQTWPTFDMIFVRQHRKDGTFRVLHGLTLKREAADAR